MSGMLKLPFLARPYWAPVAAPPDDVRTRVCRKCGAEFQSRSRVKKRCDACQDEVTAARGLAHDEARRVARKAGVKA